MKKTLLVIMILFVLVFSSCQGLGGGRTPGDLRQGDSKGDEDLSGLGLSARFETDDDWISQKRLDYALKLENTGKDEVKITRENFKFGTIQVDNRGAESVFTSESEASFYSKVFASGDLVIFQNANREFAGELYIGDWFFNDANENSFKWFLEITYPYKTHVKNNVVVDLSEPRNLLDVTDRLEQAAPIKVTAIEINPTIREGEYRVDFTIQDRGPSTSGGSRNVLIENIEMVLGTQSLSDCVFYVEEAGKKRLIEGEPTLTKDRSSMIYSCATSLSNYVGGGPVTTTISGIIEYKYKLRLENEIRLPNDRLEDDYLFG